MKKKVKEKLWKIKNNLEWHNGDEIMDIVYGLCAEMGEKSLEVVKGGLRFFMINDWETAGV